MISAGMASYVELDTVLGVQDMYDILEVILVDAHNRRMIYSAVEKEQKHVNNNR